MSGFAAVACQDGQPINRELLTAMALALRQRGPDSQQIWTDTVGLALVHALFLTTTDVTVPSQPFSFDGATWIAADARIDARDELLNQLRGVGRPVGATADDAALILHAWHSWGANCVERLLGDFSFVIVNTAERRLFAARDPLGVKPLFYARTRNSLVLSNDLDCTRRHSDVGDGLDESWISDFLLFGWNMDVTATVFRDIRRLPGGHWLDWSPTGLKIQRYWQLSVPDEVWLPHPNEYVERFRETFQRAVRDRLRAKQVAIAMSGGLDSTAIAATAVDQTKNCAPSTEIRALTCVWDPVLRQDCERIYATAAASFLGIPLEYIEGAQHLLFDHPWDAPEGQMPEPAQRTCLQLRTLVQRAAVNGRVILHGEGGDEALRPHPSYFPQLLREGRLGRWITDVGRHWQALGVPPVGLRTTLRSLAFGSRPADSYSSAPDFPAWFDPDLKKQLALDDRWRQFWRPLSVPSSRSPAGQFALGSFLMPYTLDWHDAAGLWGPAEIRFPWLDLRVIDLCWCIPPVPLRCSKLLVRRALHGRLPETVLGRRKSGLAGDLLAASLSRYSNLGTWQARLRRTPELARYVQGDPLRECCRSIAQVHALWLHTRPLELASWLEHRRPK